MRYSTSTAMQLVGLEPRDFAGTTSGTPSTATALAISIAVTSITRVPPLNTTVSVVTTAAHRLVDGQEVTVAGANQSQYNGRFRITVTSATAFTYVVTEDPGASASGTVTVTYTPMAQWACIVADAANGSAISFGANSQADFWPIAAGSWFTLPLPMGAKLDLTRIYVKSAGTSQAFRVLFY